MFWPWCKKQLEAARPSEINQVRERLRLVREQLTIQSLDDEERLMNRKPKG